MLCLLGSKVEERGAGGGRWGSGVFGMQGLTEVRR